MYIKIVYLSFILVEFLYAISAECDVKRVPRSSDDPSDKLKFYVECPNSADPMVSMASENQPTAQDPRLSKLLRLSDFKNPLIKKPILPKKAINLDKIIIPKSKPEMPKLNFDQLRNPLSNVASKLATPRIKDLPDEAMDLAQKSDQLRNNFNNILDKPSPNGRFSNVLKDFILSRRKNQDLSPSPSDIVANEEPELIDDEELPKELTMAEKLKAMAERQRKILEEKLADAKSKIPKLTPNPNLGDAEEGASNNDLVAQAMPDDSNGLRNSLSERAKLLREKLISPLKRNMEAENSAFPQVSSRQSSLNNDISQIEPKQSLRFDRLAEKTKTIARKLKKLIDMDMNEEREALRTIEPKLLDTDIASRILPQQQSSKILPPQQESARIVVPEKQQLLADKLKNLMNQNPRKAESPLIKRQKDEPIISASNPNIVSDVVPDKISNQKAKMAERVQIIADKIRNAIEQSALNLNKMRSSNDLDSEVDNSNVDEVVADAPDVNDEQDMEGAKSDAVVQEVPKDDIIDLTKEGGKSADICKCIRIAFPEKFENGHFVMQSPNDDTVRSASENTEQEEPVIPSFKKISGNSILGNKLKNIFRSRTGDLATMADEARPMFAVPPENMAAELSNVERAKMADQGIRSLLEFVKIVDQVDQYITTKARRAISRLATVLSEDEDARLL